MPRSVKHCRLPSETHVISPRLPANRRHLQHETDMVPRTHEETLPSLQAATRSLLPHQLPKCLFITAKPPKTHFAQLAFAPFARLYFVTTNRLPDQARERSPTTSLNARNQARQFSWTKRGTRQQDRSCLGRSSGSQWSSETFSCLVKTSVRVRRRGETRRYNGNNSFQA